MGQVIEFSKAGKVKRATTEELKKAWKEWDGDPATMWEPFDMEQVHAELNLRGEGRYCAV